MKRFIAIALFFVLNIAYAQDYNLKVKFTGLHQNGKLMIALYQKNNFLKNPTFVKSLNVYRDTAQVTFESIPAGDYALSCFLDTNGNSKFDYYNNGQPSELWGMSTNTVLMAAPTWTDAKFELAGDKSLLIEMKNH